MRPALPAAARAALLLSLLFACGTETGVLVEVTRDETVPPDVDRLSFYVGTDVVAGELARFADLEPEEDAQVAGRDLVNEPYRLLLRPGEEDGPHVMVAVLAYRGGEVVGFGALAESVRFVDGAVTRWPIVLTGAPPGGFAVSETGCLTFVDESGDLVGIGRPGDRDCDGFGDGDCDDLDPAVNPGATDACGNSIDEDCDGQTDENVDDDADQVTTCDGDCDDRNDAVHPGAAEVCDGADNDCNGACDDGLDGDGDHYTACGTKLFEDGTCLIDESKADCDDRDPSSYPGAAEVCDGADNDCDGSCEEDSALDPDGDLYTACGSVAGACGASLLFVDCAPEDGEVHPGAAELCDGIDNDCDGVFLQAAPCYGSDAETGACFLGVRTCAEEGGSGAFVDACQPAVSELNEVPTAACAAYDACDDMGATDPYGCAIDSGGANPTACEVAIQASTAEQCPQREVVLPTDGLTACSWAVVGGAAQGDYLVGLRPVDSPATAPQPTLASCEAVLHVVAVSAEPPGPWYVILRRQSGDEAAWLVFEVSSLPAGACNPPDGLTCEGLTPPG